MRFVVPDATTKSPLLQSQVINHDVIEFVALSTYSFVTTCVFVVIAIVEVTVQVKDFTHVIVSVHVLCTKLLVLSLL